MATGPSATTTIRRLSRTATSWPRWQRGPWAMRRAGWLSSVARRLRPRINLLENYLRAERKLQGDYDRTDLLWASTEFPGLLSATRQQQLIQMIFSHQKADGGWSIRDVCSARGVGQGQSCGKAAERNWRFQIPQRRTHDGPRYHRPAQGGRSVQRSSHSARGFLAACQPALVGRWWTRGR
jgi:hypothetical protein